MKEKNVGSVVVVDEAGHPIGIVTDRDLAVKVIAEGKSADTPVDEIMSHPVFAVSQEALVFDTLREMARRHVHRIPDVNFDIREESLAQANTLAVAPLLDFCDHRFTSCGYP